MIPLFSVIKYATFISQCYDLCKTSGTSPMERYACQFSLTVVTLGVIGFIAEVFNALEYIKGNYVFDCIEFDDLRYASCTY